MSGRDDPRTSAPNDGNGGFLREEARLAIVFLSDEEDFSPRPLGEYEAFFKGLKHGDPEMLKISAIAAPKDLSTCPTASSTGGRYIALADSTGGVTENICTKDWSRSLQSLALHAFGLERVFKLTYTPRDPAELSVSVDGTPLTRGWSYDAGANSVIFESAPAAGAQVEVTYPR